MADNRFDPMGLMAISIASQTITRPANTTAYASGQLVANNTTPGSVTPFQFINAGRPASLGSASGSAGRIIGAKLWKSSNVIANAAFRAHFFAVSPAVANGDGGVFSPSTVNNWIASLDITVDQPGAAGAIGRANGPAQGIPFVLAGFNLFALLEARGAYTPVSAEQLILSADILQN